MTRDCIIGGDKFTEKIEQKHLNVFRHRISTLFNWTILERLKLGAYKGETVYWYESLANSRGYSTNIKDISICKYKNILWNKIEDMLSITGYNIDKIKELIYGHKFVMQSV